MITWVQETDFGKGIGLGLLKLEGHYVPNLRLSLLRPFCFCSCFGSVCFLVTDRD